MSEIMDGIREVPARAFKGLTSTQRHALEYLAKRRDANPTYPYGFRLRYQFASAGAAARRVLEPAGLVTIDRVTPRHFLDEITDAGRAALSGNLADATKKELLP